MAKQRTRRLQKVGKNAHKPNQGFVVNAGNPNFKNQTAVIPPPLVEGKERCPSCRNVVTVRTAGRLYAHNDLFGVKCWNRQFGDLARIEVPPVDLADTNVIPPNGRCQECSKAIPPMRRLCGRCSARRDAA